MSLVPPNAQPPDDNTEEWPTNEITIICTVIDCLLCILTISIYLSLCCKSHRYLKSTRKNSSSREIEIHPPILAGTLIACTLLLISVLFTVLYTINSQEYVLRGGLRKALLYIQVISIGLGKLLCHLIFVQRLKIAFEGSDLAYPNCVFYLFYCAAIIMVVGAMTVVISLFNSSNSAGLFSMINATAFSLDGITAIVVLLMFVQKLRMVFIQRRQASLRNVHKVELQAVDMGLVQTVTKLTLLSLLNALSSLFLFGVFLYRAIEEKLNESEDVQYWKIVYAANVFFILSAMVNIMVLYLVLRFARGHYEVFCNPCHDLLRGCCEHGFAKALVKHKRASMKAASSSSPDSADSADRAYVE
mmetsp:Transcript_37752/g.60483  ORF Transcript_37752/g.60483 Transcript_37752/m.60483 type:complete len:359 (-) Transcript_37752:161-1237(-)